MPLTTCQLWQLDKEFETPTNQKELLISGGAQLLLGEREFGMPPTGESEFEKLEEEIESLEEKIEDSVDTKLDRILG